MINLYKKSKINRNTVVSMDWNFFNGGYLHLGHTNFTMFQCLGLKGSTLVGTQKEFVVRFQVALDREPKFSWFTFEAINPYDARIMYLWIKVWKSLNLRVVVNLGWRLTRESRDYVERKIMEANLMRSKFGVNGSNAKLKEAI